MERETSFGEWVKKRRRSLYLTRQALAQRVNCSAATIRKIEADERRPSLQMAELLAQALEISTEERPAFIAIARKERAVDALPLPTPGQAFPWQLQPTPKTNLPVPATLFVGRRSEVMELTERLKDPACRLLTLLGPGGMGKTRLAIHLAHLHLNAFPDGVYFIPLASISDPQQIPLAIGAALRLSFPSQRPPAAQLFESLRSRRMLLVLDNLEHLLGGAPFLAALLESAPGVRLLATTIERVNLQGEWVYSVEGLACPGHEGLAPGAPMQQFDAVQLFMQSAIRADPRFDLSGEDQEAVLRICALTGGMPLAIELAAGWVRVLSCAEIAEKIAENASFLKGAVRGGPARHSSLWEVMDHSWKLLDGQEKLILSRLAVFEGGFRGEAAQAVAGASLENLASLLDKSLIRRAQNGRYFLHELIRRYAAKRLKESGQEEAEARERHRVYYAGRMQAWEGALKGPRPEAALPEMAQEMVNLRRAWQELLASGDLARLYDSIYSLSVFYEMQGRAREAAALFEKTAVALAEAEEGTGALCALALAEAEESTDALRAAALADFGDGAGAPGAAVVGRLLTHLSRHYRRLGLYRAAQEALDEALGLLPAGGDREEARRWLAQLMSDRGDLEGAGRILEEALAGPRPAVDDWFRGVCLSQLGYHALALGQPERASALFEEAGEKFRGGDLHQWTLARQGLALAAARQGQEAAAMEILADSQEGCARLGSKTLLSAHSRCMAEAALALGRLDMAESYLQESLDSLGEPGEALPRTHTLLLLGECKLGQGRPAEAQAAFEAALRLAQQLQIDTLAGRAMMRLDAIEGAARAFERRVEIKT